MRDETVRDKIVRDVEAVTKKIYVTPPGGINLDPAGDVVNINLLRFIHFPEKKQLVFAALKSKNDLIKQSGLLVAAEDYPDIILSTRDVKATFDHHFKDQEGYEALLTYFALRHPSYVKRVQAMIGPKAFDETTEKLRREGIAVNYWASYGFAGLY